MDTKPQTDELKPCAECGYNRMPFFTEASSVKLGRYYKGEPICQRCLDKHRESAWNHREDS